MAEWKSTAEAFNGCNELQTKKKVYNQNLLSKTHSRTNSRTCSRTFLCGELSTKVLILCGVLSVESVLNFWKQASERHREGDDRMTLPGQIQCLFFSAIRSLNARGTDTLLLNLIDSNSLFILMKRFPQLLLMLYSRFIVV